MDRHLERFGSKGKKARMCFQNSFILFYIDQIELNMLSNLQLKQIDVTIMYSRCHFVVAHC